MNMVLIAVLAILIFSILYGYHKGLLKIVYSMVSGVLILVLVALAAPHISDYLKTNTQIYHNIAQHCEKQLKQTSAEKLKALEQNVDSIKNETLTEMGIYLPEFMVKNIFAETGGMADAALEQSGICQMVAYKMAEFVTDGISFLAAWVCAAIVVGIISSALNIFSRVPVISGLNRFAGVAAGGLYGLMLVWVVFCVIALCSSSQWGMALVSDIYKNVFLTYLYENNLILACILKFF